MGINDEYSRDAYVFEQVWNSDYSDGEESEVDPEDWQALNSDELLNGWMIIRAHLEDNYKETRATYNDFIQFVMHPNTWFSCEDPSPTHLNLWRELVKIPVIHKNVSLTSFVGWTKNFVPEL